jgi:hypothetical protein
VFYKGIALAYARFSRLSSPKNTLRTLRSQLIELVAHLLGAFLARLAPEHNNDVGGIRGETDSRART